MNRKEKTVEEIIEDVVGRTCTVSAHYGVIPLELHRRAYILNEGLSVKEFLKQMFGVSEEGYKSHFQDSLEVYSGEALSNNPYLEAIKGKEIKEGRVELVKLGYKKNEVAGLKEFYLDKNLNLQIPLTIFDNKVEDILGFKLDGNMWMSITPTEIETMNKHIEDATGKVLTAGLGLGYFAYMCALKEDVESVTVIEVDRTVIEVFQEHLLPLMGEAGKKIQIVHQNLFDYLKDNNIKRKFDYSFIDIFLDLNHAITICDAIAPVLKYQKGRGKITYWLEQGMKNKMQTSIISGLKLRYLDKLSYREAMLLAMTATPDYDPQISYLIKGIHVAYKKINIKNELDLKKAIFNDDLLNQAMTLDSLGLMKSILK